MKKGFYLLTILAMLLQPGLALAGILAPAGAVLYVKPGAAGINCTSWADACELQDGLAAANAGDEIWVAEGVYYPGPAGNRLATFQLKDGVAIYGGFMGTETNRADRNRNENPTILSGDIDDNGTLDDGNAYHVVTCSGMVTDTAILDGFTITAGNAQGGYPQNTGGGMYNIAGNPTLTDVTFTSNNADNSAGGMYNVYGNPTLTDVTFTSNYADNAGGGMCNTGGSPTLTDVTFADNTAGIGGGMYTEIGNPVLTNVTFFDNSATLWGGGMVTNTGSSMLTNVTFYGNSASQMGGGILNYSDSNQTLTNAILWGNTPDQIFNNSSTAFTSYSDIQGSSTYPGTGNINQDPLFVDAAAGNLRLLPGSPAIDAGSNAAVPVGVTTDLDGSPRFVDMPWVVDTGSGTPPLVDMGAYEAQLSWIYLPVVRR